MLLVNNAALGSFTPTWLGHAEWSGAIHFADLVFPWFLLMVGMSIPLSFAHANARGVSASEFRWKSLVRSGKLFLLGMLLVSSVAHTPIFSLGVLQLIALAFLGAVWVRHWTTRERTLLAFGLLLVHWAVLRFVPAAGAEMATFAPGQTWVDWVNTRFLAPLHLSGLLSVVPTTAMTLLGSVVGQRLAARPPTYRQFFSLTATAAVLLGAGWLWSLDIPFNKPLWTASYITFTAGLGTLLLALMYLVVDLWGCSRLAFCFSVCGANAIFAYVVPILVKVYFLWGWTVPVAGAQVSLLDVALTTCRETYGLEQGGWIFTLGYVALWWCILCLMHQRKIFWKV